MFSNIQKCSERNSLELEGYPHKAEANLGGYKNEYDRIDIKQETITLMYECHLKHVRFELSLSNIKLSGGREHFLLAYPRYRSAAIILLLHVVKTQ